MFRTDPGRLSRFYSYGAIELLGIGGQWSLELLMLG
jgi:hypothetical protein